MRKNGNRLECDIPDIGQMRVDTTKLRQILFNLLSNGAKFTRNGKVDLDIMRTADKNGEWVRFRVNDTGIGIAYDWQSPVFESFVQADGSSTRGYGGTGLGLSVAKSLCELMGGTIELESQPGNGTTFTIRLPAGEAAGGPTHGDETAGPYEDRGGTR